MTIKIPTGPAELESMLSDGAKMKEVFADAASFKEFIKNYAGTMSKSDTDISAQVREQTQAALAEFMRDNQISAGPKVDLTELGTPVLNNVGGSAHQAQKNALYNKAAMGGPLDGKFESFSDFMQACALSSGSLNRLPGGQDMLAKLGEVVDIQNSYGSNAPSDGGFLVPESFRSDLLMLGLEKGIIRPRATVIPMATPRVSIPTNDSTSNVSTVFGGVQVFWVDESTAAPESSAKFSVVTLDAKKLMAYSTAPNELIADASAFGAFMNAAFPAAIAFEEDYRFQQGTGVAQPLGYINAPAAVVVAGASHLGANTIGVEDLAAMFARMLPSSLGNAIWVASIDCFPQLATLALQGTLGNSTPVWMNNGVAGAPPVSIYGRPVYFTEKAPPLGTTGDISFIDPSMYLIGDRQSMEVAASPHYQFGVDKTAFRVTERVDGRPWLQSPITPKNGSANTLSAFVQLSATRT